MRRHPESTRSSSSSPCKRRRRRWRRGGGQGGGGLGKIMPSSRGKPSFLFVSVIAMLVLALLPCPAGAAGVTTPTSTNRAGTYYDLRSRNRDMIEARQGICEELNDCTSCFRKAGCGWCGATGQCTANPETCEKGWSDSVCYTSCPEDSTPMHEAAGVIQLGSNGPRQVYYLGNETCSFTIWPLPEGGSSSGGGSGTSRRAMMIRLQFEYVDLGPNDEIEIYSNGLDGPKILSITGTGQGVINRIITSRSSSVVIKLNATGTRGGTGFRLYYRVIESSPLDIYLISAIIVTSILTCILCSCCCNNCVAMIAGHPGRRFGGPSTAARSLSAEEKARLPIAPYDATDVRYEDFKECCICLSEFEHTDVVRTLPCGHFFHPGCIDAWLDLNSTCPLCKKDVRDKLGESGSSRDNEGGGAGAGGGDANFVPHDEEGQRGGGGGWGSAMLWRLPPRRENWWAHLSSFSLGAAGRWTLGRGVVTIDRGFPPPPSPPVHYPDPAAAAASTRIPGRIPSAAVLVAVPSPSHARDGWADTNDSDEEGVEEMVFDHLSPSLAASAQQQQGEGRERGTGRGEEEGEHVVVERLSGASSLLSLSSVDSFSSLPLRDDHLHDEEDDTEKEDNGDRDLERGEAAAGGGGREEGEERRTTTTTISAAATAEEGGEGKEEGGEGNSGDSSRRLPQ